MDDPVRRLGFSRRALLLGAGMAGTGTLLAGRLAWLSLFEGERYQLRAQENRIQNRLIPPRRGWIVDRHGKPLAMNRPDYRLELRPAEIDNLDSTLDAIRGVITLGIDDEYRIRDDVARQPRFMPVVVRQNLSWPEFSACNVRLATLPGVAAVQSFSRFYPEGERLAHLLGYVGAPTPEQYAQDRDPLLIYPGFRIGKDGIERHQDRQLRGTAGASRVEVTARGELVRELGTRVDAPGDTLKLTIDRGLQSYTARRLADNSASVIVIDCQTGDLLCMVSMPAYDPNIFSRRVPASLWQALQADDHTPLLNKSAMGLYPPGSTFKMVTTLAALEAGVDPDEAVGCSGAYRLGSNTWHCHARRGHGGVNMHRALPLSCDTYFYVMGRRIGIDAIADMARRLGLGQEYELPVPGQAEGIVPDKAWKQKRYGKGWREGETLNAAIGQGYIITNPLQLAVMTARLASGRAVMPRLIAPDAANAPAPEFPSLGIPEAHLAIVRQGMIDVVNARYGTARAARSPVPDVTIAGKTGTAQVRRITMAERRRGVIRNEALPWKQRDHALFVAFAPAESPRYAASVILEHGIAGGRYAAPIARDVLSYLFEPERALAVLPPIEAEAARRRAERTVAEAAASIARERQQMMPSWLKIDLAPPEYEIADADAPQPPREPE